MTDARHLPEALASVFREIPDIRVEPQGDRRLQAYAGAEALPALLELLKGRAGYLHLSAISCVDWPDHGEFELVYHLWSYRTKVLVSAHIRIPRDRARYVSVYDIHAPAYFFERDIHEMFGVYFEGSPDMGRFILTEWDGPPPMRKDFSSEQYVEDTYEWQDYRPDWLQEVERKGGGLIKE